VDRVFHSDQLYAATCSAMAQLGWVEPWLDATARAAGGSHVRISSLFPWQGNLLLAPAPANLWPAPANRLRTSGAVFIPTSLIATLAAGSSWNEDQWEVDGWSQCLVRRGRRQPAGPYRVATRSRFACDRVAPGQGMAHRTACLEFADASGLWCAAEFSNQDAHTTWNERLRACFRLLADCGLGGERTSGWGHFDIERIDSGELADLVLGPPPEPTEAPLEETPAPPSELAYWLLSLYSPAEADQVDWSRGCYALLGRSGRAGDGTLPGNASRTVRMVREGSMLFASQPPQGAAPDVAPVGFPHPVYRAGFAVALPMPWRVVS
jgi:CRISPR type III-A-associated RAMP protein Csm4